jgi:hypothetical protein
LLGGGLAQALELGQQVALREREALNTVALVEKVQFPYQLPCGVTNGFDEGFQVTILS